MCCTAALWPRSPLALSMSAPTSAVSSAPGRPAASRGEKFQLVGEQAQNRAAPQRFLSLAHQFAQGGIGLLDHTFLVAGNQHIAHGREQAENELLRLLQLCVFFFQLHFVADQLGVDLVHLLDHIEPGRLIHPFELAQRQMR